VFAASVPRVDYADPWDLPFEERFTRLKQGRPRAAYYYALPDTSTFRYRAYNVAQSLDAMPGGASASWFVRDDFDRIERVIDACDVVVLCRNSLYDHKVARIAALARARGRRLLFDVDDLVFDPRYAHLLMDTLAQDFEREDRWNYWFGNIGRIGATFSLCDGAIVTNEFLARHARAWSGKPVHVIPNYLNREQQEVSDSIWASKQDSAWARDGRTHLGYFSGSPSHNRDFAVAAGAIGDAMDRDPQLWLRIVGFLDLPPELARHAERIETIPLQDFINLQREIGATEVNLVPLQDNTFTNCKSELKWFEAAIVGGLTVASPTFTYRGVIEPGVNGWLAASHEWDVALREILRDVDEHRDRIAGPAREQARERYGWDRQAATIEAALFGAAQA
jgi:glycosyltransferase involved in cell wall biosynthesis